MTDFEDADPIEILEAARSLLDPADEGIRQTITFAQAEEDASSWLPPIARMLHQVEELAARYASLQRELRLAAGAELARLGPVRRRQWEDTLALHYEEPKPKQILRPERVVPRLAGLAADEWGDAPPAVLAAKAIQAAFGLAGVTASTKLRVRAARQWKLDPDDVYDQDGYVPAQAQAVTRKR